MKKINLRLLLLSTALAGFAMSSDAQPAISLAGKPYPVEVGRELPRTQTISYKTEEFSVVRSHEPSAYLQPLGSDWSKSDDGSGNVKYSRSFKVPFEWIDRQYFLYIGAADSSYEVVVNGQLAGYNQSCRSAAEFDITGYCEQGVNNVEITLFGDPASAKLSGETATADLRVTGEIYIVAQPRVRIRDYVAKTNITGDGATVELGVAVKSHLLNPKTVTVYYTLLDPDGVQSSYAHKDMELDMRREDTVRFFIDIPDAKLWSPETPHLYTILLKLQHEGRFTEYISYPIGLRTVGISDGRMEVNSMQMPLVTAEYAFGPDSTATAAGLLKLRSEGINTIKVAGHPQPDYFYGLCDRIGLYVCNQADLNTQSGGNSRKIGGNITNDPVWEAAYRDRAMTMYHTSQNHASVVMFSLAENSANGYNLYESYLALKRVERERPVIYLGAEGEWNSDAVGASDTSADIRKGRIIFDITPVGNAVHESAPDITASDPASGRFTIRNNYHAAWLKSAIIVWNVKDGGKTISQGTSQVDVAPQGTADFTVSYGKAKPGRSLTVDFAIYRNTTPFDRLADSIVPSGKSDAKSESKNAGKAPIVRIGEQSLTVNY